MVVSAVKSLSTLCKQSSDSSQADHKKADITQSMIILVSTIKTELFSTVYLILESSLKIILKIKKYQFSQKEEKILLLILILS